jgi:hypothetical protein
MGAGAIHAAATGMHAEHPRARAQLFVVITVAQLGVGLWALAATDALRRLGGRGGQRGRSRRLARHTAHRHLVDRRSRGQRVTSVRRHRVRLAGRGRSRGGVGRLPHRLAPVHPRSHLGTVIRHRRTGRPCHVDRRHQRALPRRRPRPRHHRRRERQRGGSCPRRHRRPPPRHSGRRRRHHHHGARRLDRSPRRRPGGSSRMAPPVGPCGRHRPLRHTRRHGRAAGPRRPAHRRHAA